MARSVDSVRPAVVPPHTEDLYTGTLALRVHVVHGVMPTSDLYLFACVSIGVRCTPASRWRMRASIR